METQAMTKGQLSDLVQGVLKDAGLFEVKDRLDEMAERSQRWEHQLTVVEQQAQQVQKQRSAGAEIGRFMRALAAAKGDVRRAAEYARKNWEDEMVAKALEAGQEDAGGFLVREEFAEGLIELLRPASVVRSLGPVTVPLDTGTLRMPKLVAGSSGTWIGEGDNISVTEPQFGQIVLIARKYASLVPISNDLLRRASMQVDRVVRDDLVDDIAQSTDLAFIRGDGTAGQPKGLKEFATGSNIIPSTSSYTLATVTNELGTCMQVLGDNNVRFRRPGWIMEWRTWRYLITVRDGNSNLVFKPEMDNGTLFGFPFRVTSQIPRDLGGGDESELYFCDFADVVLGEATSILMDVSNTAAYQSGANVRAAFSLDQTVIRAIVEVDMQARHNESIALVSGVRWGE